MFQYTVRPYFSIHNFQGIIFKRTYRFACNITQKMIVNDLFSLFALIKELRNNIRYLWISKFYNLGIDF